MAGNQFKYLPGGLLGIAFNNVNAVKLCQTVRGKFEAGLVQESMFYAHEAMAKDVQTSVLQVLRERVEKTERVQRGSFFLENAIMSPGNRVVNVRGFTVGIESFLNDSPARYYWAPQEFGTSALVGRLYIGLWIDPAGQLREPIEGGNDAAGNNGLGGAKAGAFVSRKRLSEFGGDSASKPFDSRRAGKGGQPESRSEGGAAKFVIKRPIPGYHYFEQGYANWRSQPKGRTTRLRYSESFGDAGLDYLKRAVERGIPA